MILRISIHAPLAGRDDSCQSWYNKFMISIHAPLAGRDPTRWSISSKAAYFNPRAPRGARRAAAPALVPRLRFQSTRPSRGATLAPLHDAAGKLISIHAPLAGRDRPYPCGIDLYCNFNPRAPRGARLGGSPCQDLSIADFNPRAPRGARRRMGAGGGVVLPIFQSTRPSRGATIEMGAPILLVSISIHAPLAGRDSTTTSAPPTSSDFNPRAPRGARRPISLRFWWSSNFNPRAPRGARQQMCTKITYIFALTHKRNTFSCQTPSVRALSKKLSGRFSHKIRCEPPCKTMCAAAPHYTISVPSGRYVCLQPKCSILLSYFFPK